MISFTKKTYLIAGAFVLAIALILLFSVILIGKIGAKRQEMFQNQQALNSFYQNQQNLENIKEQFNAAKDSLSQKTALLPSRDAIKFIQYVENTASATQNQENISVAQNTASNQSSSGSVPKDIIDFQISLWGSFPNLIKFLINLENAPYLNDVTSFQINRLTENNISTQDKSANSQTGDINSVINLSVHLANGN